MRAGQRSTSTSRKRLFHGRVTALVGFVTAAIVVSITASASASVPANLTGEFLSHLPPADLTSGTCNPAGDSTFTYTVTGTASAPYAGTFTETGTVTIGPQTEEFVPGQFRGDLTAFSATVTITSAAGSVTATKSLVPGTSNNKGVCTLAAAQIIASSLTYTATVATPMGTLADQGTAWSNFNAYFINPGASSSSYQFRGAFNSTTPPPPNNPPDAVYDTIPGNQAANVLANDSDPDGDSLTLTTYTQPARGTVTCTAAGDCVYVPPTDLCTRPLLAGEGTFTYTISDGRGGSDTASVSPLVVYDCDDVPPVVTGAPDRPANGAGWYKADVTVDWLAVYPEPSSGTPTDPADTVASTEDGGSVYTSAESCDPAGNCATGQITLSIDKTDPTVGAPAFAVNPKALGESAALTATTADNRSGVAAGEYYLETDPGEGNGTAMNSGGGSLSATIGTNLDTGVFLVCVRALDAAGNWSDASCAFLVVYDPSAGFATGGGWFVPGGNTSDPGDLLPGLDGTSKANFGFVVKYKKGSLTVPSGQLEFHYNVGNFHLHSTGMDWLVVTNSNWAKFRGVARIDGVTGEYPFQVDARDGSPDRFIIKVWAPGANPDTTSPIYKASGDVDGGQVKIHRS